MNSFSKSFIYDPIVAAQALYMLRYIKKHRAIYTADIKARYHCLNWTGALNMLADMRVLEAGGGHASAYVIKGNICDARTRLYSIAAKPFLAVLIPVLTAVLVKKCTS